MALIRSPVEHRSVLDAVSSSDLVSISSVAPFYVMKPEEFPDTKSHF
jgi:hypothetical protein